MYVLAVLAISSFLLAFMLTPPCRHLFHKWGWLDHPDGKRKLHPHAVPRAGGVPIMLAYLGAFAVLLASPLSAGGTIKTALPLVGRVLASAALVFAAGLFDDVWTLKPWQKLVMQVIAAHMAFWAGIGIRNLGGFAIPSWLSLPVTVCWLVGCCNAFNLIDGVDGLAAGAGLLASVTMLVSGLLHGDVGLAMATVPLAGALLGFLRYNFNPASMFLGDSGSLTLGFVLGCYAVVWSQESTTIVGMIAPLMALALPLLETVVSLVRRCLRQQPIFSADAGHIHHRLLKRGLTPRRLVLVLYAMCAFGATLSLLLANVRENGFKGILIVLFCGAVWIGVKRLGYVEFGVARRMLTKGAFRAHLNGHIALQTLEERLAEMTDPHQNWRELCEGCRSLGFTRIGLRANGTTRWKALVDTNGAACWSIEIPLSDGTALFLTRAFAFGPNPTVLTPLADMLHKTFIGGPSWGSLSSEGDPLLKLLPHRAEVPADTRAQIGHLAATRAGAASIDRLQQTAGCEKS